MLDVSALTVLDAVWVYAVLGLLVGSFLNVVIARLPTMIERDWMAQYQAFGAELRIKRGEPPPPAEAPAQAAPFNLVRPGSRCGHCQAPIRWYHNVPLLSFIFLRGRCAACHQRFSARYFWVEALSAVLFGWVGWRFGWSAAGMMALLLTAGLIVLAFIDADTQLLPDDITLPLLWLGLLVNLPWWSGDAQGGLFVSIDQAVVGAVVGYLSLWTIYWLYRLLTGVEGMGFGDFKLLAALGAWLGWQVILGIVLVSSVLGAVIGVLRLLTRRTQRGEPIPFGPFLAMAGLGALLYRDAFVNVFML